MKITKSDLPVPITLFKSFSISLLFSTRLCGRHFSNVSHINQRWVERCFRQTQGYYSISDEHYAGEGIQIHCSSEKNGEE